MKDDIIGLDLKYEPASSVWYNTITESGQQLCLNSVKMTILHIYIFHIYVL